MPFILELAKKYGARRVTLEANSAFTFVSSAPHLRAGLSDIGCILEAVRAGKNHHDDDAMSLVISSLFSNETVKIPAAGTSKQVYNDLIFQLLSWRPYDKKLIRDVVRAFYYAEMAARRVSANTSPRQTSSDPYAMPLMQQMSGASSGWR